jgi:hypothetical protein
MKANSNLVCLYSGKDLKTQIAHLIKGASHESVDVRQVALSKLIECLKLNKVLNKFRYNNSSLTALRDFEPIKL